MTNLNEDQLKQLKKKFCIDVTDNMDMDTLLEIVYDQLMESYDDYDQEEMKEEIVSYYCDDPTEYNTMVKSISNVDLVK